MLGESNNLSGVSQWDEIIGAKTDRPRDYALTYVDDEGRMSLLGYHGEMLYHYTKGWSDLSAQDAEIDVAVSGNSVLTCDVSKVPWTGSDILIRAAKKLYLRAHSSILGTPGAVGSDGVIVHFPLAILIVAVVISVGVLVRNSLSRKPFSFKGLSRETISPKYGSFAEGLQ